jgi:anti-sigma-K factor RskA
VKSSLVIDVGHADKEFAETYSVLEGTKTIKHDFVLVTEQESLELWAQKSRKALESLGCMVRTVDGLPVPGVE